jgi:organic hydroperoxide reductase OsmC/OhrA
MESIFKAQISWQSQGKPFSYDEYSRLYTVRVEGKPDFVGTAAPEFKGSRYYHNPEDLLVVSLSACHMLTYLAYAARSKTEVLSYEDAADGVLHQVEKVMKFKEVTLRPRIVIAKNSDLGRAHDLHDKAHQACFIANSVNFPIKIASEIMRQDMIS